MSILPIALDIGLAFIRNVAGSRNHERTSTASLSQLGRTHSFNLPTERLPSLGQERQAGQMVANMHNDSMREQRFENNRTAMSAMLRR